uniref:Uncharacterized protein n=2 Tax=Opuntia streptacantha TaxID=393608 RepID=A0A7C9EJI6_OPUST
MRCKGVSLQSMQMFFKAGQFFTINSTSCNLPTSAALCNGVSPLLSHWMMSDGKVSTTSLKIVSDQFGADAASKIVEPSLKMRRRCSSSCLAIILKISTTTIWHPTSTANFRGFSFSDEATRESLGSCSKKHEARSWSL